jgi:hypothetical protein
LRLLESNERGSLVAPELEDIERRLRKYSDNLLFSGVWRGFFLSPDGDCSTVEGRVSKAIPLPAECSLVSSTSTVSPPEDASSRTLLELSGVVAANGCPWLARSFPGLLSSSFPSAAWAAIIRLRGDALPVVDTLPRTEASSPPFPVLAAPSASPDWLARDS